jgi:endoglucanase
MPFPQLAKGVNIQRWSFNTTDLQQIRELGFTYVRLPIEPNDVLDRLATNLLDVEGLALLQSQIATIISAGLAVMVDMHNMRPGSDPTNIQAQIEIDPNVPQLFANFWENLAIALSGTDPTKVFLEILNEPIFWNNPADWEQIQTDLLIPAIRQGAPNHTIVATSAKFSHIDTMLELTPSTDPNVIYAIHFYEPMTFTHQGADWVEPTFLEIKNLDYPAVAATTAAAVAATTNQTAQEWMNYYGTEGWGPTKISARLGLMESWATQHDVTVVANEFGVYREFCSPISRQTWHHDVRMALEASGIGWALWHWSDNGFRLKSDTVDAPLALALGLLDEVNMADFVLQMNRPVAVSMQVVDVPISTTETVANSETTTVYSWANLTPSPATIVFEAQWNADGVVSPAGAGTVYGDSVKKINQLKPGDPISGNGIPPGTTVGAVTVNSFEFSTDLVAGSGTLTATPPAGNKALFMISHKMVIDNGVAVLQIKAWKSNGKEEMQIGDLAPDIQENVRVPIDAWLTAMRVNRS